jgi:hypothetical protein
MLSLSEICASELCVPPVLLFFIRLELVPDLVLGEVHVEMRDLLVAVACATTQNLNNIVWLAGGM